MTPSEWHAQDDAGHDEMQLALYMRWQKKIEAKSPIMREQRGEEVVVIPAAVWVEFPITSRKNGTILAFADVAVRFDGTIREHNHWGFFELKPLIKSVGGLLRQCHAIEAAVWRSDLVRDHHSGRNIANFDVAPVVYEDDPRLSLLRLFDPFCIALPRGGVQ